ncbi:MAG: MFS transporter [Dehalococcoidia bacterium]|nr:MFS transporter [Dehalococcoidia bacterium]
MPEEAPLRRNRDFVLLQAGQLLSRAGSGMSGVAYPLLALAATGSPAQAGLIQAARFLPHLLLNTLAGVVADRYERRRLMVMADAVCGLALASLVAAIAMDRVTAAQLLIVGFVDGCGSVLFGAAYSGAFRSVVPRSQLAAAASVDQARASTVRLAAPPLGGALYGLARVVPFVADAVSYAGSTILLLLIRRPFQAARDASHTSVREDLKEGLKFLWHVPFLRISALMTAVSNFSFSAGQFAVVVLARREGYSSTAIGLLVALVGVTTLAGSLISPQLRRWFSLRVILLSELWASFGVLSFIAWPNPVVLAAALAAQAFCFPNTDAAVAAYRYAVTPDRLTARVTSAASNIAVMAMPLGPLVAGVLLEALSPRAAVLGFTAACMAAAIAGTLSRTIRTLPALEDVVAEEGAA